MNLQLIENRITDLLKLTGISEEHTIEELTDHYLTRIEDEIINGVNSQQAIRETFQEIANIDASQFIQPKETENKKWLMLLFILFLGLANYVFQPKQQEINVPLVETVVDISPPSGYPIQDLRFNISSEFGFRMHPTRHKKELHKGIDIRAKIGTSVLSAGEGKVLEAGYKSMAGNYIVIEHEGNYITKYYHLSEVGVKPSEIISEGQVIGKVGNSGLSTKAHLHFEILKDEVPVNPREYIRP